MNLILNMYNVYDQFRNMGDEALELGDEHPHTGSRDDIHGDYEQLPGTGADTSWDDGLGNILTLGQVLARAEDFNRVMRPDELKHMLIPTERDPARVQAADTDEPILIAYDGTKPIKILDGQHRLQKALDQEKSLIPTVRVDVNSDPKLKQMFDPEPDPPKTNENV